MNYQRIYNQLISRARLRNTTDYTEKHHIVPKCLGGEDHNGNLVSLTYREHTLAHWLLVRIYPHNHKLAYAFDKMVKGGVKAQHPRLTSRMVEEAKSLSNHAKKASCWVNKDGVDKKVVKDELNSYIERGYLRGRCKSNTYNRIRISKDAKNKFVLPSEVEGYLQEGWLVGGTNKESKWMSKDDQVAYVSANEIESFLLAGYVFGNSNLKSKKCITKDGKTKRISESDLQQWLDAGWVLGYDYQINKGKRFMSRGSEIIRVDAEQVDFYIKKGYKLGYEQK